MDFDLTEEQRLFRKVLQDFVADHVKPVAREWELSGRYPTEIVEKMKEMGLFGITIPQERGGLGLDLVSMALVFEEISRGWMGIAGILGSHSLSCWMIDRHGTDEQKARWLWTLAAGELRTGIALTEPGAGSDLQGITTRAVREGDHYLVRGTKMWITNARHAGIMPVLVKTDPSADPPHRGMSVVIVEAGTPGYEVGRDIPKLGYKGTESCEIVLDNCRVPAGNLLGGVEGRGLQQVLSALEVGRVNVAARSVGIAQAALDSALAYSQEREAFGRAISEFQAIQTKLADMATDVQAARLLVWWAAWKADQGERADLHAGMAKLFASEVALRSALEAIRIHGGYGYSTEFDIERLYRDSPLMAIGEGTNEIQRLVIARGLLRGEKPGS
ncbi:MAG: acyl-CoA dehydrogenase family protein [Actinomycetota bacterium]